MKFDDTWHYLLKTQPIKLSTEKGAEFTFYADIDGVNFDCPSDRNNPQSKSRFRKFWDLWFIHSKRKRNEYTNDGPKKFPTRTFLYLKAVFQYLESCNKLIIDGISFESQIGASDPILSNKPNSNATLCSEHYIAYHSAQKMGYEFEPSDELRFLSKKLGLIKKAIGNKVWVVQGTPDGKKTAFTLCGCYIADSIIPEESSSGVYVISGQRVIEFDPPLHLNELDWFPALIKSQSNFSLGFNRLNDETVKQALIELESESPLPSLSMPFPDIDLLATGSEGKTRLVSHLRRERNRNLVAMKKSKVLNAKGKLSCEVCGFDFSASYGNLGDGFCEVHHLTPLSAASEAVTTTLADLSVLCSNCHRIIHRSSPMLSVADLFKVVQNCSSELETINAKEALYTG